MTSRPADHGPPAHPLLGMFLDAAEGRFPAPDGSVTWTDELHGRRRAVVAFTGHAVIAAPAEARARVEHLVGAASIDGFGGAMDPAVLVGLADGGTIGTHDVTLVARGSGRGGPPRTRRWDQHPRVRHARELRRDVTVHGDDGGFVTLGTGLADRTEIGVELVTGPPGTGRELITAALGLVDAGSPVFAAVSPGNARSLRAFLGLGFVPIASEVIITPGHTG